MYNFYYNVSYYFSFILELFNSILFYVSICFKDSNECYNSQKNFVLHWFTEVVDKSILI